MPLSRRALLVACLVTACTPSNRDVVVELRLPDGDGALVAAAGQAIIALPYDRDSVMAALEAQAGPRPHARTLDSLYDAFAAPYGQVREASATVARLEERVTALRAGLDSLGRGTPEYAAAFGRERQVSDSLAAARRALERAEATLAALRGRMQPVLDSLRADVRAWQERTYAGYDTLTDNLSEARMATPAMDTTDAQGRAYFQLPAGPWWIYARAWDATDPNREWYWNAPVGQDTVTLEPRTGSRRSRY